MATKNIQNHWLPAFTRWYLAKETSSRFALGLLVLAALLALPTGGFYAAKRTYDGPKFTIVEKAVQISGKGRLKREWITPDSYCDQYSTDLGTTDWICFSRSGPNFPFYKQNL